jgi:hypothetical protein
MRSAAWTAYDDARLRELITSGKTYAEVAEIFDRSKRAIELRVHGLNIPYIHRQEETERIAANEAAVCEQLAKGLSYDETAAALGRTRGWVGGVIHRMRLREGKPAQPDKEHDARNGETSRVNKAARAALKDPKMPRVAMVYDPIVDASLRGRILPDEPPSLEMSCEDLLSTSCRWVHGDPKQYHHYCGHTVRQGSTFCDFHHKVCYTPYVPKHRVSPTHAPMAASERVRQLLRQS